MALKGKGLYITDAKGKTLARWFLARPVTAKYSITFHVRQRHQKMKQTGHHSDTDATRERFDKDVKKRFMCLKEHL